MHISENMVVSARADLMARLEKSIIFSLLALLHLSHAQCYKMRSQTAALFYITAPQSPEALSPTSEVSQAVLWQWSMTHSMQFVLPFHYKPLLSCKWLSHTSAVQLKISHALVCFCGVKFSQNLGSWTLSGFANVFFFFFFLIHTVRFSADVCSSQLLSIQPAAAAM